MGKDGACLIGFDLGGTKMLSAVFDEEYRIIGRAKRKTNAEHGEDRVLSDMIEAIKESLEDAKRDPESVTSIGIASPGALDRAKGVIVMTPNMSFRDFPIGELLKKEFGVPVLLENDVNAGTYGEFVRGAAQGYRHVLGVFPGTGIGGGIVLDGKLYRGASGNAGEIGHMIIQTDGRLCGCGQRGCVEAMASKTALAKDAVALASSGNSPTLFELAGTDFKKYKSKVFAKAIEKGDDAVIELVDRSAWHLGIAMANLVNVLSPEIIVIGGGLVEKLGKDYVRKAESSMRAHAMESLVQGVHVVEASLGDDAVILGAASLARMEG
jgi:glucokinase